MLRAFAAPAARVLQLRLANCAARAPRSGTAVGVAAAAGVSAGVTALALSTASPALAAEADKADAPKARPGIRVSLEPSVKTALKAKYDTYGGVIVDVDTVVECVDSSTFQERLASSVATWRKDLRRGVWLKIPVAQAGFLQFALEQGFEIHHAEKDHVMLTLWIPKDQGVENTLPGYTSHTVGVGGVVINERNEILVVQERSGPAAGINFWKYPTGMVEAGEDASTAVVREIKEETGIDAEVVSLVGFREAHAPTSANWMSGTTNMFMVFLLRPKSTKIAIQEREIAKCEWLPLDEYWGNAEDRMKPGTLYHSLAALACDVHDGTVSGFENRQMPLGFRPGTDNMYYCKDAASRVGANESRAQKGSTEN